MGRQVTVGLAPLLKAGCALKVINHGEADAYLQVEAPDGSIICSDDSSLEYLVFDCRSLQHSPNAWMEAWMIDASVPYAYG